MSDFTSLQAKVEDLRTKVAKDSITPEYLGALLDDFISQMKSIDISGMSDDISTAISSANSALTKAKSALDTASTASSMATSAVNTANAASDSASSAKKTATEASGTAADASDVATEAKGMADAALKIGSELQSSLMSHDTDIDANTKAISALEEAVDALNAMLGEASGIATLDADSKIPSKFLPSFVDDVLEFSEILENGVAVVGPTDTTDFSKGSVVFNPLTNTFVWRQNAEGNTFHYYTWPDAEFYGEVTNFGVTPATGKIFTCTSTSLSYRWSGTTLSEIGASLALGTTEQTAFPGDRGLALEKSVASVQESLSESVGDNCVNVSAKYPKDSATTTNTYYNLKEAIEAIIAHNAKKLGMQITFASAETTWKMYQYVGASIDNDDLRDTSNWQDMASLNAGEEPFINVNRLCGSPSGVAYYTLAVALTAISEKEKSSGITYRKKGMVITYEIAEGQWETKQLKHDVGNFGYESAWADFGQGGSTVEVDSELNADSKNAIANAAVVDAVPVALDIDDSTPGVVKVAMVNAKGNQLGQQKQFTVGTGSGETAGTTVTIALQKSTVAGAVGKSILINAAIRSVSKSGNVEVTNAIESIALKDYNSKQTVWSKTLDQDSSDDFEDFSFSFDVTDLFDSAQKRKFYLEATDALGNTGQNIVTVSAEDVTVVSEQSLNYDEKSAISPDDDSVTVAQVYGFPLNTIDKGIRAIVEIKIDGAWLTLQDTVVTDQFSHAVKLSPKDLGLKHGAYQIRVHGESMNSGVKGNTIYSTIFVVDPANTTPMVGIRYNDTSESKVKLYETVSFDIAVYNPVSKATIVNAKLNDETLSQQTVDNSDTLTISRQVQGVTDGATLKLWASIVPSSLDDNRKITAEPVTLTVDGSVIDATLKDGALFAFDFSGRSNSETDHSIVSGKYAITLTGANYTTNGFGTYLGENCLRIAENVKATLNYAPFSGNASLLAQSGCALQFAIATNNIKDSDAMLMQCYDPKSGVGFYVKGNKVGFTCYNGTKGIYADSSTPIPEERAFACGEKVTVSLVVEPTSIYKERDGKKYSMIKLYLNGEEVGVMGYTSSGDLSQDMQITLDGTDGDLYLFYLLGYNSYMEWAQAWKNYLVKLTDTVVMLEEYEAEDVLVSQTAEGSTKMRPSREELWARGIPYYVIVAPQGTFDTFDGTIDTSKKFPITLYYFDPKRPWRSFKAVNVQWRPQGTTSALRPIKNDRFYLCKYEDWEITPLYADYTNDDALVTYRLFAQGYVRVGDNTIPTNVLTVKVDYSDSSGTNDCGTCNLFNALYRALGDDFMTPAQRAFDGTWSSADGSITLTGLELNHSTANHIVAAYRSTSDTLQNVYFHAKGNWKEDKSDTTALGFNNISGYNKGCLNPGEYVNYYGKDGETLDQIEKRFLADDSLNTAKIYALRLYAGQNYRIFRYLNGAWTKSKGSMKQVGGKWIVQGDVLNPVTGYEMLQYTDMCWLKGVSCVEDMMKMSNQISSWVKKLGITDEAPLWTYYFECMSADDATALALAQGKMCPYELYRYLEFANRCDLDQATTEKERTAKINLWESTAYKYTNIRSLMVYYVGTDYLCLTDQQAKNMQPMWFLEDGFSVTDGVYSSEYALRMYPNKVYDADGAWDKDNEGGCTVDAEVDPGKATDEATGYSNPFSGWNSVQWVMIREAGKTTYNDAGDYVTLNGIAELMSNAQCVEDGETINPFSKSGALHYYVERMKQWPKLVSSYDGERKYIEYTSTSNQLYLYALQGLGLTSLPDYISRRWKIRDGFYQTGSFTSEATTFTARISAATTAKVRIVAAKRGYFGVGSEKIGNIGKAVFLEAGEEYTFSAENGDFSVSDGTNFYIYQADRIAELDISDLTLSTPTFNACSLLEILNIGSATHIERPLSYEAFTALTLSLPFLRVLDTRNSQVANINVSGCPRIETINAAGSKLASLRIAETSPINDITLPATMADVSFVGLPNLTYTGLNAETGLRVPSWANVTKLRLETSPNINAVKLLTDVLASQPKNATVLANLRINPGDDVMSLSGPLDEMIDVLDRGVKGIDSKEGSQTTPVVSGDYLLTRLAEQSDIDRVEGGIEGINVLVSVYAYITLINEVNGEGYGGDEEVEDVTLDTIGDHLLYYNGETYEQYLERIAEENQSIHEIITQ